MLAVLKYAYGRLVCRPRKDNQYRDTYVDREAAKQWSKALDMFY